MLRAPHRFAIWILAFAVVAAASACSRGPTGPSRTGITRDEAIELARPHLTFEPLSVDVRSNVVRGRSVWTVVFRGRPPGQGSAIGEYLEVSLDRATGEIVQLAIS